MCSKDKGRYATVYGATAMGGQLIDGEEHGGSDDACFSSLNPACRGDVVGIFPQASQEDVEAAVRAAGRACESWKAVPDAQRGQIIADFGRLLGEHRQDLARLLTREVGLLHPESLTEIQEIIDTACDPQAASSESGPPEGVSLVISTIRFPLALPGCQLVADLLCGNTVVWNPSAGAPTVGWALGRLLVQAGVPAGVINILHGDGQLGESLMQQLDQGLVQKVAAGSDSFAGTPLVVTDEADLELLVKSARLVMT